MFGEGLELQTVEGILAAADILHCVFPSAAFTVEVEERRGGDRREEKRKGNTKRQRRRSCPQKGMKEETQM